MSTWTDTDRAIPVIGNARSADIPKILANFKYLATLLIAGRAKGWTLAVVNGSGSAEEPQYRVWSNGVERVRATYTYATGAVTQIAWEYSDDSGTTPNATGTWAAMMTETATYDGSGNQTTGNHSGLLSWLFEWIAKFKSLRAAYTAHIASSTAHSMGDLAVQLKNAVDIIGGTIKGVVLEYVTARGKKIDKGNMSGAVDIDWSTGDYFYGTITGVTTLTFSNLPGASTNPAGSLTLELTNPGAFTLTWPAGMKWPGGVAPTRTVAGVDLYEFVCRDGTTVRGAQAQKDSK